jgi:hypothetical protein
VDFHGSTTIEGKTLLRYFEHRGATLSCSELPKQMWGILQNLDAHS